MYGFVFLNRLSRKWTVVSKDQARQNRYFGFRGWLLFFYSMTVLVSILYVMALIEWSDPEMVEFFGGYPDDTPGVDFFLWILWFPFLVLAPMKHSLTPKVWIASEWIEAIVSSAAVDMSSALVEIIVLIALSVIKVSLMTWYVLHSKRVNVTYLSRVPAQDATKQP